MREQEKAAKHTISRADGVVWSRISVDLHHPVRSIKGSFADFFLMSRPPPPRLQEGSTSRVFTSCSKLISSLLLVLALRQSNKDDVMGATLLEASAHALHLHVESPIAKALFKLSIFPCRPDAEHSTRDGVRREERPSLRRCRAGYCLSR